MAAAMLLLTPAAADEIVLTSGKKYQGLVISRTEAVVTFKAMFPEGGSMVLEVPVARVASLVVDGKAPVLNAPAAAKPKADPASPDPRTGDLRPAGPPVPPAPPGPVPSSDRKALSKAEADAVIQALGKTPPDWWDSVPLSYPDTMDLAGTDTPKGWNANRNVGQYLWSVVTPNPSKWKSGIKLLHHALDVRKDDPPRLAEAMNMLGRYYSHFERDYARAAFWWQKAAAVSGQAAVDNLLGQAEAYWQLGSKQAAVALLSQSGFDRRPHAGAIKLWAEMGETRKALELCDLFVRAGWTDEGHLQAGNVCRLMGDHKAAIAHYEKALAARTGSDRIKKNQQRAQECLQAVKLYEALDLKQIADAVYTGTAAGYRGPLTVEVSVKQGRIESVKVTQHKEDIFFTAMTRVPAQIVEKQGVKRIDAVSSATITSEAIVNATAKALYTGMK